MILPSGANIVILASNYNPSIVSKEWLYQKGIFTETVRNFVHTPVFALVESEDFSLVVDEERLQITVRKMTQDSLNALVSIAEKFIDILPETPYKGMGLNYRYTFPRKGYDLHTILSPNDAKLSELLSPTYELGATVVFEFERFVVTFTVSPSLVKEQQIRMRFNFHSNTANVGEVKERLSSQMRTLEKMQTIIQGLSKDG
jgi:hypothetical protein